MNFLIFTIENSYLKLFLCRFFFFIRQPILKILQHILGQNKGGILQRKSFLLCLAMDYRDFSVKSKVVISLFQTVAL